MKKMLLAVILIGLPVLALADTIEDYTAQLNGPHNHDIVGGKGEGVTACKDVALVQRLQANTDVKDPYAKGYDSDIIYAWFDRACQFRVYPRISALDLGPRLKGARVVVVADKYCFGPSKNSVLVLDGAGHVLLRSLAKRLGRLESMHDGVPNLVVMGPDHNFLLYQWNANAHRFDYTLRVQDVSKDFAPVDEAERNLPQQQRYAGYAHASAEDQAFAREIEHLPTWIDEKSGTLARCEDAKLLKASGAADTQWVLSYPPNTVDVRVMRVDLGAPLKGARVLTYSDGTSNFGPAGVWETVLDKDDNVILSVVNDLNRLPSKRDGVNNLIVGGPGQNGMLGQWNKTKHRYEMTGFVPYQ